MTDGNVLNSRANNLAPGDEVFVNELSRPLEVTGRHRQRVDMRTRSRDDYHYIVELEGFGTEYHLLWDHGSGVAPMLYRKSEWTERDDVYLFDYTGGERVGTLEVK
jgi:hypothetical protein